MSEAIEPPPTSEEEEVKRRAYIPIAVLILWYKSHRIPLDVPLRIYVPRGDDGESA
jgi:hypothetical protein